MLDIMAFWLDRGIDGFRVDAVPYLIEREGTSCENLPETHAVPQGDARPSSTSITPAPCCSPRPTSGRATSSPTSATDDEFHMAFNFPLMPRLFMAIRREDRRPIVDIMAQMPSIPPSCQWALFLRNHDELTLEMVTDEERDYMYEEYAKDPRMRINLGIRRRLAPLMENGRRQMELLYSLLFTLPGTPVLYYGDEIGMGDNIHLGDRNGVRTPMQWSGDRNAGFSRADPSRLYQPVILDPLYNYQAVNVEAQIRSPTSLLNWLRRLIRVRKSHEVFGRGSLEFVPCANHRVVAYSRSYGDHDDPRRQQPLPLRPARRAGPAAYEGAVPGRDDRQPVVPAHREPALLRHPQPPLVLLVPAGSRRCEPGDDLHDTWEDSPRYPQGRSDDSEEHRSW